ncbi:uncharacterized protein LOC128558760 [Mercenaria mercenaria]|uniref:uncharacterized protein LOC128558760 n=1 Tax=Mercenaria mercenaria TaxID=6596 RepID=UPI00234FA294|nr:uncharacterized protein LOC128558760 [Mercenaria mercenaria]
MFTDSSAPGKKFPIYVDNTMTRLIVEVETDRSSPVMIVTKPSGLPGYRPNLNSTANIGTVSTVRATMDVAITMADYGIWMLNKLDANTWNVKFKARVLWILATSF